MGRRIVLALTLTALVVAGCGKGDSPGSSEPPRQSMPTPQVVRTVPTVLILDASGSMAETDAPGPRIDAAKSAAEALVDALPDAATLGLTTYGSGTGNSEAEKAAGCLDVTTRIPLGALRREEMRRAIDGLRPSGWTPISLALNTAVDQLPADDSAQAVVLVSDGEDTCGAPPCDAATQAKRTHPGLSISTIGFKTAGPASDQLACIAAVTGGLFVQASNASQLTARLLATQNISEAEKSLSSDGLGDIKLGATLADIRARHKDFPDAATTGRVTVVYRDCDWGFVDGVLDSIAQHGGGRTIDGVAQGSDIRRAAELYGKPLQVERNGDGTHTAIFDANPNGDAAYSTVVDGYADSGGALAGVIKTIVLCRCKPKAAASSAGPETIVLKPVDAQGNTQSGWMKDSGRRDTPIDCSYGSPSPFDVDGGVRSCGTTADSGDACWPTAGGSYVLCLIDPFSNVLHLISAQGANEALKSRSEEPRPMALVLDDGTQCRAVTGGAWPRQSEHPDYLVGYACGNDLIVWGPVGIFRKGPDGWTVEVGPSDGHLSVHKVVKAYYVGVA
jgi:Ca-activated chloride channel family protein